jgi:phytoene dehydrogenase-like protein
MRLSELRTERTIAASRHINAMEKEAEKYHEQAIKAYPDALDKKSKMGQRVAELTKRMPALLDPKIIPDGWLILTDLANGQLQREAKLAATAAPKTAAPPKLTAPAKTASVVARTPAKPGASTARAKALETGDIADVDRALEAILS